MMTSFCIWISWETYCAALRLYARRMDEYKKIIGAPYSLQSEVLYVELRMRFSM